MSKLVRIEGKTLEDAITKALIELEITSDQMEYTIIDKGSTGFLGIGYKPFIIEASKKETVEDRAFDFLKSIFEQMQMSVDLNIVMNSEEGCLEINASGEDMGTLIGKRGQTLDSLQYLVSLVVNKGQDEYLRVKLDTENYRERRKETLESLAKNIAYKVKRTRRPVKLEPMNPYERRIIHSALQGDKQVITKSEGEEPFRHVVIMLKRDQKDRRYS